LNTSVLTVSRSDAFVRSADSLRNRCGGTQTVMVTGNVMDAKGGGSMMRNCALPLPCGMQRGAASETSARMLRPRSTKDKRGYGRIDGDADTTQDERRTN
jgi:hypothetical protein